MNFLSFYYSTRVRAAQLKICCRQNLCFRIKKKTILFQLEQDYFFIHFLLSHLILGIARQQSVQKPILVQHLTSLILNSSIPLVHRIQML